MSAETLRRAASLMRERAERATPGKWEVSEEGPIDGVYVGMVELPTGTAYDELVVEVNDDHQSQADAAHIASWHPAVALATADWLDATADRVGGKTWTGSRNALAVARAYLGESA